MNCRDLRFRWRCRISGGILLCLICVCHQANSDDSEFSASRTVIVVSDKAEAFAGNESVGKVPSGSVLRYSKEDGPWLLIPRYGGWLGREHVVALERAIPYFDDVVRKDQSPQAYQHRGIAHMSLGSYDSAIADFGRAIDAGLDDASVYINRGVAKQRRGDLAGAVEDYTRAIERDATSARAYDNRANALAELGELDASIADSNEALRISPKFPEAFNNRGVTRRLKGDFEQAIADYTQAIEFYPHYAAAYANRGYARKQLGQATEAVADYAQSIALDAQNWQAHNDLAWLLATTSDAELFDPERALELAQIACDQTRMRNPNCLDTLAAAQAATGDFPSARQSAEAALRSAPESTKAEIRQRLELYTQGQPYREE